MKYRIAIEETFRKVVEVEAPTAGAAVCKAEEDYNENAYELSKEDYAGCDIALDGNDKTVRKYLADFRFMDFVQERFIALQECIPDSEKIRLAFGSMDNAIYEYREEQENNRRHICLLYSCNAWNERASMELVATFRTRQMACDYMQCRQKELGLSDYDLAFFRQQGQTQGRDRNYMLEEAELNPIPGIDGDNEE